MTFLQQYLKKRREAHDTIREIHDADMVIVPRVRANRRASSRPCPSSAATCAAFSGSNPADKKYAYSTPKLPRMSGTSRSFSGLPRGRAASRGGSILFRRASPNCRRSSIEVCSLRTWLSAWHRRWTSSAISPSALHLTTPWRRFERPVASSWKSTERAVRRWQLQHSHLTGQRSGGKRRAHSGSGPACHRSGAEGDRKVRCRPHCRRSDPADRLRRNSRCGGHATQPQA